MTVHRFIAQRHASWDGLTRFVAQCSASRPERIPLEDFRGGSLLYRQAASDLAFARMKFPDHSIVRELEALVSQAHSAIYRAKVVRRRSWHRFWIAEYPALIRASAGPILVSCLVFWIAAAVGVALTLQVPALADAFVSPGMKEALARGELWTQRITTVAPQASSAIAQNNITVSLTAWALGLTFGVGTLYLVALNGLMLGAITVACLRYDMLVPLAQFIAAHGALELPAIWITSGAGLLLARALILPGRYSRRIELRIQGRRSVRLAAGTVPVLLVAAGVEGFISPSNLPPSVKCLTALLLALAFLVYVLVSGRAGDQDAGPSPA
jgi:uncharacterized membrane protein SpoIIM required for sporulation